MIHIEQNQIVPENDGLRVLSVTGDYADNDLIECAHIDNPDFALSAFSATFIRYGGVVYQHSDPLKLGEALLAIDPESTHDAVTLFKEEEARRIKREGGDFTPENPVPADESVSQITQEEARVEEEEKKADETEEKEKPAEEEVVTTPKQPESEPETGGGDGSVPEVPAEPVIPVEVPTTPTEPSEIPPTPEADLSSQNTPVETIPERPVEIPEPVEPPAPFEALIESVTNGLTE